MSNSKFINMIHLVFSLIRLLLLSPLIYSISEKTSSLYLQLAIFKLKIYGEIHALVRRE